MLPVVRQAIIKLPALYQQIIVDVAPMRMQNGTAVCIIVVFERFTDAPFEFGCEVYPAAANGVSSAGALMRCLTHTVQRAGRRDIDQCRSWARGAGYTLRMLVDQMQAEA